MLIKKKLQLIQKYRLVYLQTHIFGTPKNKMYLSLTQFMKKIAWIPLLALFFTACTKGVPNERYLIFKFKTDPAMERLNDTGGLASMVALGNGAQDPNINYLGFDHIELATTDSTLFGMGLTLFHSPRIGNGILDFSQLNFAKPNEEFFSIPLSLVAPGTYKWLRVGIPYENFDMTYRIDDPVNGVNYNATNGGTMSGFLSRMYVDNFYAHDYRFNVKDTLAQNNWGFETVLGTGGFSFTYTDRQHGMDSSTTAVNPMHFKSPIPVRTSIVTGALNVFESRKIGSDTTYEMPLTITGLEKDNVIVECVLSTNKSFEWRDVNGNGKWDPFKGEPVIDMGLRGMKPRVRK